MSDNAGLIDALQGICRATNAPAEITRAVLRAAKGEPTRPDKTVTTKGAAGVLECSTKTVFRYAERGLLHPIRRSARSLRWRQSEVERLAFHGAEK